VDTIICQCGQRLTIKTFDGERRTACPNCRRPLSFMPCEQTSLPPPSAAVVAIKPVKAEAGENVASTDLRGPPPRISIAAAVWTSAILILLVGSHFVLIFAAALGGHNNLFQGVLMWHTSISLIAGAAGLGAGIGTTVRGRFDMTTIRGWLIGWIFGVVVSFAAMTLCWWQITRAGPAQLLSVQFQLIGVHFSGWFAAGAISFLLASTGWPKVFGWAAAKDESSNGASIPRLSNRMNSGSPKRS